MFDSLIKVNIDWKIFLVVILMIPLFFPYLSWFSFIAAVITIHQFFLLFYSINYVIPIRYLFGTLMCLQMFVGPILAFNGFDKYQPYNYQMKVPEIEYFSFVIPAVALFILGLHFKAGRLKGELWNINSINKFANEHSHIPYLFIIIGFISSFISEYFSGSGIKFFFYVVSNLKFVGAFMLILSDKKLKILPLIIVAGSIISSSLAGGLFHDLIIWSIFLGTAFCIRFKPTSVIKLGFFILFVLITIIIQQLKGGYRSALLYQSQGIATLTKAYEKTEAQNELFNLTSLAKSSIRINQGFIITNIMKKVPNEVPFSNGAELREILEAAFLPRILAPNKLKAGDQTIFTKYTGIQLGIGTTMGLSSVGDAYLNFGIFFGSIFMLSLGLLYNEVLKALYKYSKNFSILLIFTTVVFYFPIRPDSELQTNLGHLVKSLVIIFAVFTIWRRQLMSKDIPLISRDIISK